MFYNRKRGVKIEPANSDPEPLSAGVEAPHWKSAKRRLVYGVRLFPIGEKRRADEERVRQFGEHPFARPMVEIDQPLKTVTGTPKAWSRNISIPRRARRVGRPRSGGVLRAHGFCGNALATCTGALSG
jgi:hypothetical protein